MRRATSLRWTTALGCLALSLLLQACVPQEGVRPQPTGAAPPPVIVFFEAHPPGLTEGGTTTLKWRTRDAVSVHISGVGDVPPAGSKVVEPRGVSSYLLTARNRDGRVVDEEVRVGAVPLMGHITLPPLIVFFKAEPPQVMVGSTTTLTWRVENAERVEITGLGQVPPSGTRSVDPGVRTHFQLSAANREGKTSTAALQVMVAYPQIYEPRPRFVEPVIAPTPRIEQPEIRPVRPSDRPALRRVSPATVQPFGVLPAPAQRSPRDGSRFSHVPRDTTLRWAPVEGAASYTVEIDCYQCCRRNAWCTEVGRTHRVQPSIRGTSYHLRFVGAQPGRWRVWAVDGNGKEGAKSVWWNFKFTR